jgi:hypothetical protein
VQLFWHYDFRTETVQLLDVLPGMLQRMIENSTEIFGAFFRRYQDRLFHKHGLNYRSNILTDYREYLLRNQFPLTSMVLNPNASNEDFATPRWGEDDQRPGWIKGFQVGDGHAILAVHMGYPGPCRHHLAGSCPANGAKRLVSAHPQMANLAHIGVARKI